MADTLLSPAHHRLTPSRRGVGGKKSLCPFEAASGPMAANNPLFTILYDHITIAPNALNTIKVSDNCIPTDSFLAKVADPLCSEKDL